MPNGYTLAEARTRLGTDRLDDPNNRRWVAATLDRALQSALTRTLDDLYRETGGVRLREEASITSSATGTIDLTDATAFPSGKTPLHIASLSVTVGNDRIPVYKAKAQDRQSPDNEARDYFVYYIPDFQIPTNTAHPLIGNGATASPGTWRTLEDLVILEAAIDCAARDPKGRAARELRVLRNETRERVIDTLTNRTRRFPPHGRWYPYLYWHHVVEDEEIVISRRH